MLEPRSIENVYGIETEYSCTISHPGGVVQELVGECHSEDFKLGLFKGPSHNGIYGIDESDIKIAINSVGLEATHSGMLSNGGRLYIDPSGTEYATPETSTAEEAVHRTFDGDQIILGVFKDLEKRGVIDGYQFNRKCVDHNRSSRGIHLNHTTTLDLNENNIDLDIVKQLATLNIVKGAIFGSGGLLLNENGKTEFHHSPRLSLTDSVSARWDVTYGYKSRPLVRIPFKPDGPFNRIESVSSDALNYAWPLKASLVATNAILRLIENGDGDQLPIVKDQIRAALNVGKNGNNNLISVKYPNKNRIGAYPSEILSSICEIILNTDQNEEFLDKESRLVLPEIIDVCDRIQNDFYSVYDQVESVGRLVAIENKMNQYKVDINSEKICRVDYAWDLIGSVGYADTYRRKNLRGWQGFGKNHSELEIKKRLIVPPQDTRAKVRGDLIRDSKGDNQSSWDNIDVGDQNETCKYYFYPLKTEI